MLYWAPAGTATLRRRKTATPKIRAAQCDVFPVLLVTVFLLSGFLFSQTGRIYVNHPQRGEWGWFFDTFLGTGL